LEVWGKWVSFFWNPQKLGVLMCVCIAVTGYRRLNALLVQECDVTVLDWDGPQARAGGGFSWI
jgi:hypothetical protein